LRMAQDKPPLGVQKAIPPIRTLSGSAAGVKALAFSADDKTLLSAGDTEIRFWDASTGAPGKTLHGHTKASRAVAISSDGTRVAGSGEDGTLILWNVVSGEVLNRHTGRNYDLHKLSFSPQGDRLLGSRGAFASLFDPNTGEEVGPILGHAIGLSSLSWSPNGKFIAAGSLAWPEDRATAVVWEIAPAAEAGHWLTYNSSAVRSMDGKVVITGPKARLNAHVKYFRDFKTSTRQILVWDCFAADSDTLVVAWGNEVVFHSMQTDKDTGSMKIPPEISDTNSILRGMALSPNGKLLATVRANTVQIWNIATAQLVAKFHDHGDDVDCLVFSHDGKVLATGSADKTIKLWDMVAY
ncbi:MAG: repeat, subgroup, partial [Chthonomonadales bacterium]|nr:repeat, subgroup [Chthonomonadales bacterium]